MKSMQGGTGGAHWLLPLGDRSGRGALAAVLRPYRWSVALVGLLGLLASLLEGIGIGLLIPLLALALAGRMPDDIPAPVQAALAPLAELDPSARILAMGGVVLLLIVLKGVVQGANNCLIAYLEGRAGRDVRDALAGRILGLRFSSFLAQDQGRLVNVIATDSWLVLEALHAWFQTVAAVTGLAVFGLLVLWLDWRLFGIALVGVALVTMALRLPRRRLDALSGEVTATNQLLAQRMLVVVGALRAIRVFGQREREQRQFAEVSERLRKWLLSSQRIVALTSPTVEALIAILIIAVLYACYLLEVTLPETTALLVLMYRAEPLARLAKQARVKLASVQGSIREVEWALGLPVETEQAGAPTPPVPLDRPIRFERVSYSYPNGHRALDEVSFELRPGVATALIGPSGAGKTTLINLLCRLVEPDAGTIRHGADDIAAFDAAQWRRSIAVAGQDLDLVHGTVAENIAYGRPEASAEEIGAAARAAGAEGFIAALPQGYHTPIGLEGLSLSGGQRQRIGLARALLRRPDLLIFDEATSAVDAMAEDEIMALLAEHRMFRTALVISHRRSTLALCEYGVVLDGGRVIESGPLKELDYFRRMGGTG